MTSYNGILLLVNISLLEKSSCWTMIFFLRVQTAGRRENTIFHNSLSDSLNLKAEQKCNVFETKMNIIYKINFDKFIFFL